MKRQLHLNLFIHGRGHHEASWRHPASSPKPLTDVRYYQDVAQRAETALFDSIFLADQLALGGDVTQAPRTWLEPITALAALAVTTSRVGLIATASTTYTEPFNLARQFASIDHISNGRAGWNIVTSWLAAAADNYGGAGQVSHADRYARGEEFMAVVKELWDSWAADAVIDDRASGFYARRERIRPINHRGDFYAVAGPLNLPRCPQGRPVLVQAGSSDTGRSFAARHADAVFTAHVAKVDGQGVLRRSEGAGARRGAQSRARPDPAGLERNDRLDRDRGATPGARSQRPVRPDCRPQAIVRPVRRSRFLATAARPTAGAGGFSRPELGRGSPQPHRGDPQSGAARQADLAAIAELLGRCTRTLLHGRHPGASRRPHRGLVCRRRRGRVQHHAARAAGTAGPVLRRGRPAAAAPGAVSHRIHRNNPARALRASRADKRLRRSQL